METNQIRLELKGFKAIQDADIILNGITVVTGENGSGKSTLSKFLYYVFKTSNEYEALVNRDLIRQFDDVYYFMERLNREAGYHDNKLLFSSADLRLLFSLDKENELLGAFDLLFSVYEANIKTRTENNQYFSRTYRLRKMIEGILEYDYDDDENTLSLSDLAQPLKEHILKCFSSAKEKIQNRPSGILESTLKESFSTYSLPREYRVIEYGVPIVSEKGKIERADSIKHVAYIDTPMLLGAHSTLDHWNETNEILKGKKQQGFIPDNILDSTLRKDILKGDTYYDTTSGNAIINSKFTYKREDGSEFNLLECATGVKSFAILQMMLKNGFLNKHTLLILDEPESHLHPQWVIEYARLIVLLNKHIGVKFFIASHNPDMVSAIKYISEKEETDKNLNFYIATPEKESQLYRYIHLGTDIEPIFESFNIALDRISLYGSKEEEE